MAQLVVRNLEDAVVKRLKERAAANGRSAEDALASMPDVGTDADFNPPRDRARRVRL